MVCTDCKLVGGDSGGPLFNMRGEVVGIHSSIGPMVTHNFHVPVTAFRKGWDRLLASEVWGGRFDDESPTGDTRRLGERPRALRHHPGLRDMPAEKRAWSVGDVIVQSSTRQITAFLELSEPWRSKLPAKRLRSVRSANSETIVHRRRAGRATVPAATPTVRRRG